MSRRRVLVLGASGMLGHKLCEVLGASAELEVHATARRQVPAAAGVQLHVPVDVSAGTSQLSALLGRLAPDVIVNAIGAIKQKDLEASLDQTFFLNAALPHELTFLNGNPHGRVIHISTDCVFAGDRGAYAETDKPDALDVYGRSKAAGELDYGHHLTIRTSIIGFERQGQLGLLSWLLDHAPGTTVRGYTQAIFSGLPTITLARTIRSLLLANTPLHGLYHVASEPISKYDLLVRVNERLALGLHVVPDETVRIDRSLDDSRFRQATGTTRPAWSELLEELKQDYDAGGYGAYYPARRAARAEDACSR